MITFFACFRTCLALLAVACFILLTFIWSSTRLGCSSDWMRLVLGRIYFSWWCCCSWMLVSLYCWSSFAHSRSWFWDTWSCTSFFDCGRSWSRMGGCSWSFLICYRISFAYRCRWMRGWTTASHCLCNASCWFSLICWYVLILSIWNTPSITSIYLISSVSSTSSILIRILIQICSKSCSSICICIISYILKRFIIFPR